MVDYQEQLVDLLVAVEMEVVVVGLVAVVQVVEVEVILVEILAIPHLVLMVVLVLVVEMEVYGTATQVVVVLLLYGAGHIRMVTTEILVKEVTEVERVAMVLMTMEVEGAVDIGVAMEAVIKWEAKDMVVVQYLEMLTAD